MIWFFELSCDVRAGWSYVVRSGCSWLTSWRRFGLGEPWRRIPAGSEAHRGCLLCSARFLSHLKSGWSNVLSARARCHACLYSGPELRRSVFFSFNLREIEYAGVRMYERSERRASFIWKMMAVVQSYWLDELLHADRNVMERLRFMEGVRCDGQIARLIV